MPIEQILQGWWIPSQPKRFSKGCTLFTWTPQCPSWG
jgi:hypothetical protein